MQLPGGNQHHIPDPTLFDANYADAMNAERRKAHGLVWRAEMLVLGVVGALALVGIAAWLVWG
mgnify:CR=1 FL=1